MPIDLEDLWDNGDDFPEEFFDDDKAYKAAQQDIKNENGNETEIELKDRLRDLGLFIPVTDEEKESKLTEKEQVALRRAQRFK